MLSILSAKAHLAFLDGFFCLLSMSLVPNLGKMTQSPQSDLTLWIQTLLKLQNCFYFIVVFFQECGEWGWNKSTQRKQHVKIELRLIWRLPADLPLHKRFAAYLLIPLDTVWTVRSVISWSLNTVKPVIFGSICSWFLAPLVALNMYFKR